MNILHLLWIVPLTILFGFMLSAMFAVGKRADEEYKKEKDR
jgi:hypothetical protein